MRRIRVALGDVQSAILRDILAQITELEPDMELVGDAGQPNVAEAVARTQADVVICDVRSDELPQVARELFADGDHPVVVGLAREGREAAVCIANAGAAQLMSVIRSAIQGAPDVSKVVELGRAREGDRDGEPPTRYYVDRATASSDQLRLLDVALLAEIDALESTIWDESVQRLQGLAISPERCARSSTSRRPSQVLVRAPTSGASGSAWPRRLVHASRRAVERSRGAAVHPARRAVRT